MTASSKTTRPGQLRLKVLPGRLAVCRLDAAGPIPPWFRPGPLAGLTWTEDELSLVIQEDLVPEGVKAERGWRAIKVLGPLDFSLTGVLSSIAAPLARARISIFALSTYDTDYVLVQDKDLNAAKAVLEDGFDLAE